MEFGGVYILSTGFSWDTPAFILCFLDLAGMGFL